MQEESRASLGYLSEALNFEFEHGSTSTSSNGLMIDHWDNNIHSLGDNDLHDYMTANSEPVYHGEASSSSGTKNEASSSHNEVIDLDSDSEQPSGPSQHVENVNLNAEYIELDSEDINPARDGAGSSVEGRRRRASCKRKALEGSSIDQSSSGGFHHGESSNSWTPASVDHRPGDGLNIFGSRRQVSGTVPFFPVRSNPSDQQETVNPAVFSAGTVVRQQHMSNLRLGQSSGNVFTQNSNPRPAISIPPVSRNILPPPFQWREVSSTSTVPVHLDETRPEHHPLFIPPPQLRSSRNATSGNLNIASSVPRTNSTTTGVVQPPSSSLAYQNLLQQQRRRSELARRSLISSTNQRGSPPPDGPVLHPGGDNSQTALQSFRALAAASRGRSRLTVSQMQNILGVMRRDPNHNLRIEDVMLLNQSLILDGAGGMHDRYRDMRLDVDNMSYEELLALEERIGDVCTGVNEETITNRLKQHKYTKAPQDAETSCCICQEEYSEGEDMGTLECGHDFHSLCVKEWLKQKNLCPICKMTGLNTAKKRKIG